MRQIDNRELIKSVSEALGIPCNREGELALPVGMRVAEYPAFDVTPLIRPRIAPAWFTTHLEEHLVGCATVAAIAACTLFVLVTA